jgi:ADP-heptose:LPS heptosyltransferase
VPSDAPLVALNPGASAPWRQWPAESFAAVARFLQEQRNAHIVILGSPGEAPLAEAIAAQCPGKPLVCAGKSTIKGLGALLMRCDLLITADTGPMHLAAALRTPTVSFFGSSSPAKTGPVGDFHSIIVAPGPDCVPCDNRPNCDGYPCLTRITPEMIAEAAIERLSLPRPTPPVLP